jgi:serine/threonine protein kinase
LATAQNNPHAAPLLDGKYSLLRVLGSGAAGTVYEAEHLIVGKRVAVKILDPQLASDRTLSARFVAEARAAARIAHANVVDIYDLGVARDGSSYMVMELLHGETLSDIVARRGAIPPEYACELVLQVLAGVAAAHAKGIVHRDLKPANVIVTHPRPDRPLVKVLDFGIAKGVGLSMHNEGLLGTPMYMAPEQALGREVDHRADVYAAGVILYELLTGRAPFDGNGTGEVLAHVITGKWRPLRAVNPKLPAELALVVETALAFDPRSRFSTVEELAERLLCFVALEQSRSLLPRSFRSVSPIPLLSSQARNEPRGEPIALVTQTKDRKRGTFPPVELVHIDHWSGDRVLTHSLLERPKIPRAPSPPRLNRRDQPAFEMGQPLTESERAERRADTDLVWRPKPRPRWQSALLATLFGFGIGLLVALVCGAI